MKLLFSGLAIMLFLALTICACKKDEDVHTSRQTINVTIKANEDYSYDLGGFGEEEGASISRQAMHYQTSIISRDSDLVNITYKYKPARNYVGTDEVELTSRKGSDGASPNNIIAITAIKFIITH